MTPEQFINYKMALLTYCARPPSIQKPIKISCKKRVELAVDYVPKNHFRKLNEEQVRFIRKSKWTLKELGKLCGVTAGTVWQAKMGFSYKDIT